MTIQQCAYVLKIAECGSLSEAAKRLFIAQSSLSVSIKTLEKELNIKIFERVGSGIYLTDEGAEFIDYARRLVEQSDFIYERYLNAVSPRRMYIATQHYDFVADIFTKILNEINDECYNLSLREMKTYDVIREVETAYCDIGITVIKDSDYTVIDRYLNQKGIAFKSVLKVYPHVYVRKHHPIAKYSALSYEDLEKYPYVSYEQGEHNHSFFAEELASINSNKCVEISDRASLMNVLLATDCYTVGTGIMPSELNCGRIVSIPFENEEPYTIGYILRSDRKVSELVKKFIDLFETMANAYF